jgi:hypothetical protein
VNLILRADYLPSTRHRVDPIITFLDQFWLYEGTEFLHQVLWNNKVRHEYHLVRGGDHVGPSLRQRNQEAILFLARTLNPWGPPPKELKPFLIALEKQKEELNIKDHYSKI